MLITRRFSNTIMSQAKFKKNYLFTSESVARGHPDKLCDYVSDSVLDACLRVDPEAKVACETAAKGNMVMILGEISCKQRVNFEQVIRDAVKEIGYDDWEKGLDYRNMQVIIQIDAQSTEISQGVHVDRNPDEVGAGDQGFVMGYATNETPELMPITLVLATRLLERVDQLRLEGVLGWARPDGKSQVTVEYDEIDGCLYPRKVHTVLMSIQHSREVSEDKMKDDLVKLIQETIPKKLLSEDTKIIINPSGSFSVGGPRADAGVTGRKIIVDTYGGWGGHGGGAFSGKDGTKVDRSGAYTARWIAKSLVHNGLCKRCLVQIAYAIGLADPLSVNVNSYGTVVDGYTDEKLAEIAKKEFNMKPGRMIEKFKLYKPIFALTTNYGHFLKDHPDILWEKPKDLSEYHEPRATKKPKTKEEIPEAYKELVFSQRITRCDKGEIILPQKDRQNILVTSALPYVNNVPHLGNLIGAVLSADVFARYSRLSGKNTIYICGTDMYGTASEFKAISEGKEPQEIVDYYHKIHKEIYDDFSIDFDHFCGTANDHHEAIVQGVFKKSLENNYFFKEQSEQYFSKKFAIGLADRFIKGGCPKCKFEDARGDQCDSCGSLLNPEELIDPKCTLSGETPEKKLTSHYYLNLTTLEPQIASFINQMSIEGKWSSNSIAISKSWLKSGLKPRCMTRDLHWGIKVPEESMENKVFYVWFDAPIGYISITANYTDQWEQWWKNPDQVKLYQFMGKDNVPFHTVMFPGSLMATKEKWTLLHHISTTEYLNYESGKFSKTHNRGVFGDDIKKLPFSVSCWRYYLLANRPESADSLFQWSDFKAKINDELLPNPGNLCNRVLKFVFSKFSGSIPTARSEELQK